MGELGITPVALTHIGLMPAGARTSGAEPSNSQTRSFGSSHHMRTVLGAVCCLICKMKMKVIYTGKQYIKKPTASTCWHNLTFPFTGEPHGRSRFGAGSALDEQNSVKYVKGFKELNVFSGCPPTHPHPRLDIAVPHIGALHLHYSYGGGCDLLAVFFCLYKNENFA